MQNNFVLSLNPADIAQGPFHCFVNNCLNLLKNNGRFDACEVVSHKKPRATLPAVSPAPPLGGGWYMPSHTNNPVLLSNRAVVNFPWAQI